VGAMSEALVAQQHQIVELCSRYAVAVDARDFAAVARCFTSDGSLETALPHRIMHGREGIERVLAAQTSSSLSPQHLVTNHIYTVDGDSCTGTSSFVMFRWPRSPAAVTGAVAHGGSYFDELERTVDGWRIKRRRIEILWGPAHFTAPTTE